jgi:hypothetical protein
VYWSYGIIRSKIIIGNESIHPPININEDVLMLASDFVSEKVDVKIGG